MGFLITRKWYLYTMLYILVPFTYSQIYSYTDPVNKYTGFCGCYCETFIYTIQSPAGEVIRVDGNQIIMRYKPLNATDTCPVTSNADCIYNAVPTGLGAPPDNHRLFVYKNCTYKNTCSITNDGLLGTRNVIYYFYMWETEDTVYNISKSITQTVKDPVFYFTEEDHVGTSINCQCSISTIDQSRLEIYYINMGRESCRRIKKSYDDQQLITCSTTGYQSFQKLYPPVNNIHLEINITDMGADGDDVLFFKVYGSVRINCTGCDAVSVITPSTTTSTTETTNNIVTSTLNPDTTQLQDNLMSSTINTDISRSHSPPTISTALPRTSSTRSTTAVPNRSVDPSDSSNDQGYLYAYIFGGLCVLFIIIISILVGVICCLRRRKTIKGSTENNHGGTAGTINTRNDIINQQRVVTDDVYLSPVNSSSLNPSTEDDPYINDDELQNNVIETTRRINNGSQDNDYVNANATVPNTTESNARIDGSYPHTYQSLTMDYSTIENNYETLNKK